MALAADGMYVVEHTFPRGYKARGIFPCRMSRGGLYRAFQSKNDTNEFFPSLQIPERSCGSLLWRFGILLHLLHLLHLLLAHLPLLHDLLWSARAAGPKTGSCHGNDLLGRFFSIWFVFIAGGVGICCRLLLVPGSMRGREHNLARRSMALVANHENVVPRPLQELRKHVTSQAGTVGAKNPLIGAQSLDLGAGRRCHIPHNLLQAGVGCFNAQP